MKKIKLTRDLYWPDYEKLLIASGVDPNDEATLRREWERLREASTNFYLEDQQVVLDLFRTQGVSIDQLDHVYKLDLGYILQAVPAMLNMFSSQPRDIRLQIGCILQRGKCMRRWRDRIKELYLAEARTATLKVNSEHPLHGPAVQLAVVLADLYTRDDEEDLLGLVADESLGCSRIMLFRPLGRSRSEATLARLEALVGTDPYIQYELGRTIKKIKSGIERKAEKAAKS